MYEVEIELPLERELVVQIWDWDRLSQDDLIGETTIDLEQRFLSRHRPTCGLAKRYAKAGYSAWRDCRKPTQLLSALCREYELTGPFYKTGQVTVAGRTFGVAPEEGKGEVLDSENVALVALHSWEELAGFSLV